MGFTKLDERIVFSSVMGESDAVFRIWIILLATCQANGVSPVTDVFLASITKKSVEEVRSALTVLMDVDESSRSLNDEGRRIRRVSGGFEIINYHAYREFSYSNSRAAVAKRAYRSKIDGGVASDNIGHVRTSSGHSASASASASASDLAVKSAEMKPPKPPKLPKVVLETSPEFEEFYAAYPRREAKRDACSAYLKAIQTETHGNIMRGVVRYSELVKREGRETKHIKQPAAWLNGMRWTDDVSIGGPASVGWNIKEGDSRSAMERVHGTN